MENKIFVLVNNRMIKQYKITQSIIKAYHAETFSGRYPAVYIHITVPGDQVDINVHPRKEEVTFLFEKKIEQSITKGILEGINTITKKLFSTITNTYPHSIEEINEYKITENNHTTEKHSSNDITNISLKKDLDLAQEKNNFETIAEKEPTPKYKNILHTSFERSINPPFFSDVIKKASLEKEKNTTENKKKSELFSNITSPIIPSSTIPAEHIPSGKNALFTSKEKKFNYVGAIDNTFLLFYNGISLLIIDQHAFHEKICYEKIMKELTPTTKQPLLIPYLICLNDEQSDYFLKQKENILFTFTIKNNECIVTEIDPIIKTVGGIQYTIEMILKTFPNNFQEYIIHEYAAKKSCKCAIKGREFLNDAQISFLISHCNEYESYSFCPHGRPTYTIIDEPFLKNLFKR